MRDRDLKVLLVSALRPNSDFSAPLPLRDCSEAQIRRLLRWLDQSGVAIHLCEHLEQRDILKSLPQNFSGALRRRRNSNHVRTLHLLEEFGRLIHSFNAHAVRFSALKGFTLVPDFCPSPFLRHQTDFDFLIAPESIEAAKCALSSCGYERQQNPQSDELSFATPLFHVPSPHDDIYARPRHHEVDLRISLQHNEHGVSIDMPSDCLDRLQTRRLQDLCFPSLGDDDMFSLQVMHAFNHLLGSWVRLSWLMEISHFMEIHHANTKLWISIRNRAGQSSVVRDAFGLIIALTSRLFPRAVSPVLEDWCLRSLPSRIEAWVAQFGLESALCGLEGAKLTLFVHREFIQDPHFWNSYVKNRIFPIRSRSSLGSITTGSPSVRIEALLSQWLHGARRIAFHARELVYLPLAAIRWRYGLRSVEKQRVPVTTVSG